MSYREIVMVGVNCDGCGTEFVFDDEFALFGTGDEALACALDTGWTTDGQGKHHCTDCPDIGTTDEARLALGRALGPGDVPLEIPPADTNRMVPRTPETRSSGWSGTETPIPQTATALAEGATP
jgi:hypothetical protein